MVSLDGFRVAASQKAKWVLTRAATKKSWAVFGAAALTLVGSTAEAASFQGIGHLPGGRRQSVVRGISLDGNVAVGSSNPGRQAFRWEGGRIRDLSDQIPGGGIASARLGLPPLMVPLLWG